MICPECGKEMEHGYIWTNGPFMYWTEMIKFFINGDRLNGGSWTRGAHLPAFRCPDCKLLLAKYDSYDEKVKTMVSGSALTYEVSSKQDPK